jgi:hypothetical protein
MILLINRLQKNLISFKKHIILLESFFNSNIEEIKNNTKSFKTILKNHFKENDGIVDSSTFCFQNFNQKYYQDMLKDLTKSCFYRDDLHSLEIIFYRILLNLS